MPLRGQADRIEHTAYPLLDLAFPLPYGAEWERYVFEHGEVPKKPEFLKHYAHTPAEHRYLLVAHRIRGETADHHLTARRVFIHVDEFHYRGLAGAGRPDEKDEFPLIYGEIDPTDCEIAAAVVLAHIAELNEHFASSVSSSLRSPRISSPPSSYRGGRRGIRPRCQRPCHVRVRCVPAAGPVLCSRPRPVLPS